MTVRTHLCLGPPNCGGYWQSLIWGQHSGAHPVILSLFLSDLSPNFSAHNHSQNCLKGEKIMSSNRSLWFSACMGLWNLSGYWTNNQCHTTGDGGFFELLFNFGMHCMKEQQGGKGVLPSCHSSFTFIPRLWSLAAQELINSHCKPLTDKQGVLREEDALNVSKKGFMQTVFHFHVPWGGLSWIQPP